jgi:predicted SAM-dependent methyltransferase
MSALARIKRSLPEPIKRALRPAYRLLAGPVQEPLSGPAPEPLAGPAPEPLAGPAPEPLAGPAPEPYPWAGIPFDPNSVADDVYIRHYSPDALAGRRFYNIGAGTFRHRFWTNVDLASEWYMDQQTGSDFINYDLFSLAPLPIENGKAEAVYTSHTVEHVNDEACANMFAEAHRMLKPGGLFRLTTPDIALDLAAWRRNDRDYFYYLDLYSHPKVCEKSNIKPFNTASLQQIVLFVFASHLSELALGSSALKVSDAEFDHAFATMTDEAALDSFSRRCSVEDQHKFPGFHMNWWTFEKAERMLKKAGFSRIYRSGYGQSHCPAMRDVVLFDKQDPKTSLYVEAVK